MSGCPSESSLSAWTRPGEALNDAALEHLDTCRTCRKVVATLAISASGSGAQSGELVEAPVLVLTRGTSLGRYLVLELLGVGGMGAVWAAYDPQLDRRVALKLVRTLSSDSAQAKQGLLHEAQAMAKLNHPNVRAIYDVAFEGQQAFLVMELVDGQSLSQWLATERTWREVTMTFLDAGKGLDAAHQAGLVHRDFKPDNILIAQDGRVRVTDFGLAHSLGRAGSSPAGTVAFMAPEQRRGLGTDARSDQFSYCAAFDSALPDDAPQWLQRLIAVGLASDPKARHSGLQSMLSIIEKRLSPSRSYVAWGAAIASAAVLLLAGARFCERSQVCADDNQALAAVWNAEIQQQMQTAFLGTGLRYASNTWEKTQHALDAYSRRWVSAKREACEATRIRQEQSETILDGRMACFAARRTELAALTEILSHADATVLENATDAVAALARRGMCEHALGGLPPQDSPEFQRAQQLVAKARTLGQAGKYADGVEVAEQARVAAALAGHLPTLASALVQLGRLLSLKGQYPEAEKALLDGIWAADRGRAPEIRVEGWLSLMNILSEKAHEAEAFRAGESAAAALDSLEFPPPGLAASVELEFGSASMHFDKAALAPLISRKRTSSRATILSSSSRLTMGWGPPRALWADAARPKQSCAEL